MKFSFGKAVILGLALAATPLIGCSSHQSGGSALNKSENTGDLGLQLQVGDLTVNTVSYHLTNTVPGTLTYPDGTINVTDAGALEAVLGGVPAGTWTLTLTAVATDGVTQCGGASGAFVVAANQTVDVGIELHCTKTRTKGSILIDGTTNECPDITSVVGDAPNGCNIGLHVLATDDGKPNPPGALSYTWDTAGLTGANPVLNCQTPGVKTVNVIVSDGDTAVGCDAPFQVKVVCPSYCPLVAPTCADGIINQGETDIDCGGPNCGACAAGKHCSVAADCSGGLSCTGGICAVPPTCTDGIQNGTETGVDCGGVSSGVTCPVCAAPPICTLPLHDSTTTCSACEANNCPHDATGCPGACTGQPACSDYAGGDVALCSNVLSCIRTSNCISAGATNCYCGSATLANCQAGAGNGACKAQIEAGLKTNVPSAVLTALTNVSLPGGGAMSLGQCDQFNCGPLSGTTECVPFCK